MREHDVLKMTINWCRAIRRDARIV